MPYLAIAFAAFLFLPGCTATAEKGVPGGVLSPVDSTGRYMFYFHGRIIEDQGLPAISPAYGEYQYDAIIERLAEFGFTIISEVRPPNADVIAHAERAVALIDSLLGAGVSADDITLVGASKGAYIAALSAHLARTPRLNVVLLAGCSTGTVAYMLENNVDPYGDVLTIRDVADTELAGSCAEVFAFSEGVGRHHEIVVDAGTGHGIIFQPIDEWVLPTVEWAKEPE